MHTHIHICTHWCLRQHLCQCLHKAMSSHWFLFLQSNTTGLIRAIPLSVFIIPFWQQEMWLSSCSMYSPLCLIIPISHQSQLQWQKLVPLPWVPPNRQVPFPNHGGDWMNSYLQWSECTLWGNSARFCHCLDSENRWARITRLTFPVVA